MPWDDEHGCWTAGTNGRANHLGEPLTVEQIRALPDGAEVVITWAGGNGPWPARILVTASGERCVEGLHCDPLLSSWVDNQVNPVHRVTREWDDASRVWAESKPPVPGHIQDKIRRRRGEVTGEAP